MKLKIGLLIIFFLINIIHTQSSNDCKLYCHKSCSGLSDESEYDRCKQAEKNCSCGLSETGKLALILFGVFFGVTVLIILFKVAYSYHTFYGNRRRWRSRHPNNTSHIHTISQELDLPPSYPGIPYHETELHQFDEPPPPSYAEVMGDGK